MLSVEGRRVGDLIVIQKRRASSVVRLWLPGEEGSFKDLNSFEYSSTNIKA